MMASVEIKQTTCPKCQMLFCIPVSFEEACRNDGRGFYCPQGHLQHYRDDKVAKLEKALVAANAQEKTAWAASDRAQERQYAAERSATALRGVITKQRRKLAERASK